MLKTIFFLLAFITISSSGLCQSTRYFEFTTNCGHGNWQDTSFIAATSNQTVIDSVLANLARPLGSRQFISGPITHGNGGHNHNAGHWFLWHFIPNQWDLVDAAMEVCDGCPYSDLDSDTAYWIGNIGEFCPWSGQPVREVADPVGMEDKYFENQITLFPNPVRNTLHITLPSVTSMSYSIINPLGQIVVDGGTINSKREIDLSHYPSGLYLLKIKSGNSTAIKKVLIDRN